MGRSVNTAAMAMATPRSTRCLTRRRSREGGRRFERTMWRQIYIAFRGGIYLPRLGFRTAERWARMKARPITVHKLRPITRSTLSRCPDPGPALAARLPPPPIRRVAHAAAAPASRRRRRASPGRRALLPPPDEVSASTRLLPSLHRPAPFRLLRWFCSALLGFSGHGDSREPG
mgnify:CR=1 FL=1